MKYDFTTVLDRRGKDSIAVEPFASDWMTWPAKTKEGFDLIPMWVADMNFPAVPTIPEAIIERTNHTTYGYFSPREEYFDAIIKWQRVRNGVEGLEPKHIGYENGVLGGVVSALNVICSKGDSVLLHSPTYIGFTNSLTNNGYHMVLSPLVKDENQVYRMDFEDMEKKIVENHIHAAIFCSPHNPTGRVWEQWEVEKAMEIYQKHDVYVISDEIWSDILLNGHKHVPTQSVSEDARQRTVALYAPSKTFNLAGLIGSYHIIYNDWLRDRILKESSLSHYNSMNLLSMYALIGAYKPEGYEWVDEDKSYDVDGNLLQGLYAQAIFFSDNKTFDKDNGYNIGSSTATVYLADGTTETYAACTNPSGSDYATVPEGTYHAKVGKHKGAYTALRMEDTDGSGRIELGYENPAYTDGRTYAVGINIHKPGINNLTGMITKKRPISAGCLLVDINSWDRFIGHFEAEDQKNNTVSVTVSRSLSEPVNVNRLPAFNFILNGTRESFFSRIKNRKL